MIIQEPKRSNINSLNDYRPAVRTPIIAKCSERPVMKHIKFVLPPNLDQHQYVYGANRSTEDLHTALTQLDKWDTSMRMLFMDTAPGSTQLSPVNWSPSY